MQRSRCARNKPKDGAQSDLEELKHGSLGRRAGTEECWQNQVYCQQKVISSNNFLSFSLVTNRCAFPTSRFQQKPQGLPGFPTTVSDDDEVESFIMSSNQLSLSNPHMRS